MNDGTTKRIGRVIIWALPLGLLFWITNNNLGLFGEMSLNCTANKCDNRIVKFSSGQGDAILSNSDGINGIYRWFGNNQVNIDLRLWRPMRRATVQLTYARPTQPQRLLLGVSSTSGMDYQYSDLAKYNPDRFLENWSWQPLGKLVLLTRRTNDSIRTYTDLNDFLTHLPDARSVATYNVDAFRVSKTVPLLSSSALLKDAASIRGAHTLLVYVQPGEPIDLTFDMQDINRHRGQDDVIFNVYFHDRLVQSVSFPDDGNRQANGIPSDRQPFRLFVPDVLSGVYRIEIITKGDDPFIRMTAARSQKAMYSKRIYLAGSSEYRVLGQSISRATTIYLKGTKLTATTAHQNSFQTIQVGSDEIHLKKRHKPYTISLPNTNGFVKITVPIPDVRLESDGVFVLSPDRWFSPIIEATILPNLNQLDGFDYILARGVGTPDQRQALVTVEKTITPIPEDRNVYFSISAESLDSSKTENLKVTQLKIILQGDTLPRKLLQLFKTTKQI